MQWFEFPTATGFVFATGESNGLRSLRRYLIAERGLPKENLFSGTGKKDTANYDHHEKDRRRRITGFEKTP
ncbi:MAG: hypothetical protein R2845_14780 [Thermomicrobiales bacterium]